MNNVIDSVCVCARQTATTIEKEKTLTRDKKVVTKKRVTETLLDLSEDDCCSAFMQSLFFFSFLLRLFALLVIEKKTDRPLLSVNENSSF